MSAKIKSKKWIIALSVLVLLAIVVTLVLVLMPKNPKRIINETISQSETMFLRTDSQKTAYDDFQKQVNLSLGGLYTQDAQNISSMADSLGEILEFYTFPLTLAGGGKALSRQYSNLLRAYENAEKAQKQITDEIQKAMSLLGKGDSMDSTFYEGAWHNVHKHFVTYFQAMTDACIALCDILRSDVEQTIYFNDFTFEVAECANIFMQSICTQLASAKEDAYAELAQTMAPKVSAFEKFVNYFDSAKLNEYLFSQAMQKQVYAVKNFESVYGKSLLAVVDSVTAHGFTFQDGSVTDSEGLLQDVKTFLTGVSA